MENATDEINETRNQIRLFRRVLICSSGAERQPVWDYLINDQKRGTLYDLHILVYSKPRGSVICESATALGLFLSFLFFSYLFLFPFIRTL